MKVEGQAQGTGQPALYSDGCYRLLPYRARRGCASTLERCNWCKSQHTMKPVCHFPQKMSTPPSAHASHTLKAWPGPMHANCHTMC